MRGVINGSGQKNKRFAEGRRSEEKRRIRMELMKNKRMQLKKRNNPTCFEERNEDAIYKKGRRH